MPESASFRVLAIDGGGIRGIVPATVLTELERRVERPLCRVFDLIVGTSTGGILALGLSVPDGDRPRHMAEQLLALYGGEAERIFPGGGPPNMTQRVFGTRNRGEWLRDPIGVLNRPAQRIGAIFGGNVHHAGGARYFSVGLDEVLDRFLGDALLTAALTDVVVTSYDMAYDQPVLFSSRPRSGFITNVPMHLVARATSAGPTYFEPQEFSEDGQQRALVDGGVYINNPAVLGFLIGASEAARLGRPLALVSLGTGTRNPANPRTPSEVKVSDWFAMLRMVLEAAMTGSGAMGDALLASQADGQDFRYWRIQGTVGACNFAMDDSTPENVACLSDRARELVVEHDEQLAAIARTLIESG